jgi:small subunit ribosomal protein S17
MAANTETKPTGRATKVGEVVSTKMDKTIVVNVDMRKAHKLYRRVITRSKRFYAHDEERKAMLGDVVRIEETRPLSKMMRWRLVDIVRRPAVAQVEAAIKEEKAS